MVCCEMETIRHPLLGKVGMKRRRKEEEGERGLLLWPIPLFKGSELHFGKDPARSHSQILAQSYEMKKLLYPQMLPTISLGMPKNEWLDARY